MNPLEKLTAFAGNWQGMNRLHDPTTGSSKDTQSALTVTQTQDKEVQITYTWSYQGESQQGTLSLQEESLGKVLTAWKDTWHSSDEMPLHGEVDAKGFLSLIGSYAAPPGPDWGWRIVLEPGNPFQIRMYNISPEGLEEIAVEAIYHQNASIIPGWA